MNEFWNDLREHLTKAVSVNMFYIAIDYKNKSYENSSQKYKHSNASAVF